MKLEELDAEIAAHPEAKAILLDNFDWPLIESEAALSHRQHQPSESGYIYRGYGYCSFPRDRAVCRYVRMVRQPAKPRSARSGKDRHLIGNKSACGPSGAIKTESRLGWDGSTPKSVNGAPMRTSDDIHSRQYVTPFRLRDVLCGLSLSVALLGAGSAANATNYNEATQGDLSGTAGAPTVIGSLTFGNNFIVGSSVPSGAPIPNGHGALENQDNDFFTFTVPTGEVLSQFDIGSDTSIASGDRFFLGIYPGVTATVDPNNPTPNGLLGYTLPGVPQIGTDVLPALAASNEAGFPPLPTHFSGSLGAGDYTVWVVDGDRPINYDFNLVVSAAPEPGTWALMFAGVAMIGGMLRLGRKRGVGSLSVA